MRETERDRQRQTQRKTKRERKRKGKRRRKRNKKSMCVINLSLGFTLASQYPIQVDASHIPKQIMGRKSGKACLV